MSTEKAPEVYDAELVSTEKLDQKVSDNENEFLSASTNAEEQDEGRTPTEEEMKTLRHVSEKIPISCWLVAIVELAERFSYYGLSAPFQNYMQNSPKDSPPGILALNQSGATALSYFFQFWCYVTPVFGGWIADTYWGKYKTIFVFCVVYIIGIFILFITSLPAITSRTTAIGGYIASIIIIGLATGGVKSNVSPLIADQIPKTKPIIKVLKSGERVVQDPNITIQNVFMFFYLMINIGSMSVIATTELEAHVGFWAAYLLPFCFFFIALIALVLGRNQYVKVPVGDKIINKTFKCTWIAINNKFNLEAAKPSVNPEANYPWTDHFVEEVRRSVYACKVFIFYPIYWVVYGQMLNNFISQAGQMELHGLPNDILQAIDSLAIIIFIPIFERLVYPFIRKFTPFKAITKIFCGFMFGTGAMIYAAVLQHYIYKAGPCYDHPKACAPEYLTVPNHVHVAIQAPAYFLIAISEILASITGLEYAYTKAPVSMKSFIMSIFLLTNAVGSALGIAVSSTFEDPKLVWAYTGLAVSCFIAGCLFWICFKHYNYKEDELNALEYEDEDNLAIVPMTSLSHSVKSFA
ncbi:POT family-domain-containing protein [Scheffersomyces xylosifermentans]|uniref:POT family-domain-containing protein n=1 Tax=Scheffersomyces xylosifermentans TaxID=1304137 RepID=UPI00315D2B60